MTQGSQVTRTIFCEFNTLATDYRNNSFLFSQWPVAGRPAEILISNIDSRPGESEGRVRLFVSSLVTVEPEDAIYVSLTPRGPTT